MIKQKQKNGNKKEEWRKIQASFNFFVIKKYYSNQLISNKTNAINKPSSFTSSLYKKKIKLKIKTSSKYNFKPNKSKMKSLFGGRFLDEELLKYSLFEEEEKFSVF